MKFLSIMALLVLLGCAGNKSVPNQTTDAVDDPRCEAFYEAINRNVSIDDFNEIKEEVKKFGIYLNEPMDFFEISNAKFLAEITRIRMHCKNTIFCNQKYYCIPTIDW